MKTPVLLIFDLDGTLIDSMGDIVTSANVLLERWNGYPLTAEQVRPGIGKGVHFLVSHVLQTGRISVDDLESAVDEYRKIYRAHALDSTVPYPGVRETLEKLRGVSMAVISNKPAAASRALLTALDLDHYFACVAGGDSFSEMKPSPLPLNAVISRLGAAPERTWMIGDSVYDVEAGKAAGVRTIAVTYGFQDADMLKALKPDAVVSAFAEIAGFVIEEDQSKR